MPIYEYECALCGQRVERLQRLSDPPPESCEACGGSMKRLLSAPAFQFKGTGWYVTDYGGRKSSESEGSSQGAKGEGTADKGAGEGSKPSAAKADSAAAAD